MPGMNSDRRIGVALVLAAATLWGTTGTAQSLASGELPATWFGALRLLVASAFFAVLARATLRRAHRQPAAAAPGRLPPAGVLAAGLCMAVYNLAFFAGIRDTGIALGTAIALGSGPLWAGLLQASMTRRLPARAWWLGTVVAVAGGVWMTLAGASGSGSGTVGTAGVLLCALSGLSYAVYALVNQSLVRVASAATVSLRAFTVAAALALAAAWLESGAPVLRAADAWAVAYVGIVTAGLAYLLFSQALRHIPAATGVTLALAEPVVAFALAVAVVGEQPGGGAYAGLLLVVAGVLLVVRSELGGSAADPDAPGTRRHDRAA